jgi:hypothetical protein
MEMYGNFKFTMNFTGNTQKDPRDEDKTYMRISHAGLGYIELPHPEYNLTSLSHSLEDIKVIEIDLVCGKLYTTKECIARKIENKLVIEFMGEWRGKSWGVMNGICDYGNFTFDKKTAYVTEHVFHVDSWYFTGNHSNQLGTPFEIWEMARSRHREKYGYDKSNEMETAMYELAFHKNLFSRSDDDRIKQWVKEVKELSRV